MVRRGATAVKPFVLVVEDVTDVEPINDLLHREAVVLLTSRIELAAQWLEGPSDDHDQDEPEVLRFHGLEIHLGEHCVRWNGCRLSLTEHEIGLLARLVAQPGRACSFNELLAQVWGMKYHADSSIVHCAIRRLRHKLPAERVGFAIESVRGYGFRIGALEVGEAR
jgi:two-component system response regulator MtrA